MLTHRTFCCLLMALCLVGCQSQSTKLFKANELYVETLGQLVQAREAGQISDQQYVKIEKIRVSVRVALDAAHLAVVAQDKAGFDRALVQFGQSLTALTSLLKETTHDTN